MWCLCVQQLLQVYHSNTSEYNNIDYILRHCLPGRLPLLSALGLAVTQLITVLIKRYEGISHSLCEDNGSLPSLWSKNLLCRKGWVDNGGHAGQQEGENNKITFAFQQIWSLCLISFTSHFIGLVPTEMCSELVRGHNVTRSRARLTRSVCPQRVTPASAEPRVVVCSQRASG